jgi:hypothetical protein
VPIDGAAARVMALQRRVGNRALASLVQREVTRDPPGAWVTPEARARAAAADVERQIAEQTQRLKDLERVGEDVIADELGLSIRPSPREPVAGGTPITQRRVPAERPLEERLAEAAAGEGPAAEEASRLLRERRISKGWIEKRLKEIADGGGRRSEDAKALLRDLREADKERGRLKRILKPKQPGAGAANAPKTMAHSVEDSAAKAEGAAVKEGENAAVKEGGNVAVKEGEKAVAKEVEKAATKGGALYARVAAKVGIELLEAMVPDPLDAISLLIDFASAFGEAKEAIRQHNRESGFAIGWAAYLVVPRWDWARWFAYTTVSRDVVTEILDAAGVAENAFNDGLVRGFIYGEKHSTAQSDRVRQKAFDAVLKVTGHTPGRYDDDDLYTFDRDDVYSFAAVLRPAVLVVLQESDRRRAARLEEERLAKQAEEVKRQLGTSASWPR